NASKPGRPAAGRGSVRVVMVGPCCGERGARVLNEVDIARAWRTPRPGPYTARASFADADPDTVMNIVDEPAARLSPARERLWRPRVARAACVRGLMTRDTRGLDIAPAHRFNYFPATPLCTLTWWLDGESERVLGPFPERPASLDDPREA